VVGYDAVCARAGRPRSSSSICALRQGDLAQAQLDAYEGLGVPNLREFIFD
jgi:hypothetical protein